MRGLDVAGKAPAGAHHQMQIVDPAGLLQPSGNREAAVDAIAARFRLRHVEPDPDGQPVADARADVLQDSIEEQHPAFEAAAIFVAALVGERREEPFDKVVMIGMQFDRARPGGQRLLGGVTIFPHEGVDLPSRQRMGNDVDNRPGQGGGRPVRHPALDDELGADAGAMRMRIGRDAPHPFHKQGMAEHARLARADTRGVEAGRQDILHKAVERGQQRGAAFRQAAPQ
jgi:hypothetical protein